MYDNGFLSYQWAGEYLEITFSYKLHFSKKNHMIMIYTI